MCELHPLTFFFLIFFLIFIAMCVGSWIGGWWGWKQGSKYGEAKGVEWSTEQIAKANEEMSARRNERA